MVNHWWRVGLEISLFVRSLHSHGGDSGSHSHVFLNYCRFHVGLFCIFFGCRHVDQAHFNRHRFLLIHHKHLSLPSCLDTICTVLGIVMGGFFFFSSHRWQYKTWGLSTPYYSVVTQNHPPPLSVDQSPVVELSQRVLTFRLAWLEWSFVEGFISVSRV